MAGRDALRDLLAREGGSATVARFMEIALHDPERGYYRTGAAAVGPRGDFSTVPSIHPALARAIASWLSARRRELAPRGPWHAVEVGGGGGHLAEAVLRALGILGRSRLRYHVVEVSPLLREAQRRRLGRFRVLWHDSPLPALEAAGGVALVFSNELVDSFPCHQLAWKDGRWLEVRVALDGERVVEALGPVSDPRLLSGLCALPEGVEGRRIEVHLPYFDWLRAWAGSLRRGAILTIDYGGAGPEMDRGRHGTLRAYFRHRTLRGLPVFGRPGMQDLTADVNFADLESWGERLGLRRRSLVSQREFLLEWAPALAREAERDPAVAFVLHESGAGGAYRVLEQSRSARADLPGVG